MNSTDEPGLPLALLNAIWRSYSNRTHRFKANDLNYVSDIEPLEGVAL